MHIKNEEYRACGTSGLRLSPIGLGCWSFGGGNYWGNQDQKDVDAVVRAAAESGINYFDTAEVYNEGRSESSLGIAMQGLERSNLVIGTKIAPVNCYPEKIETHCDESLKRLKTDYIDLYMIHWPVHPHSIRHYTSDPEIISNPPDVGRALETFAKLQEKGKIRQIGLSNYSLNRLKNDIPSTLKIVANQLPYNLLCRAIEFDTLPWCQQKGIGVVSYMTLLQGILSNTFATLADIPEQRRRTRHFNGASTPLCRHGEKGFEEETQQAIDNIRKIAHEHGVDTAALSTRWAIANMGITCALIGARNLSQLNANIAAIQTPLDTATLEQLNQASEHLKQRMGNHFDYYESAENDRTV